MHLCLAGSPLLADKAGPSVLLVAAMVAVTLPIVLRMYRAHSRSRAGTSFRPGGSPDPRGLRAAAPESVVHWEVEMQDLARDLKAEIDSKMVTLGQLIRDADRAAERLERALGRDTAGENPPTGVGEVTGPQPSREAKGNLRDEVYQLADYGFSASDIAQRLSTPVGQIELILRLREESR
ncbi:MAG: hypothetical protein ACYC6Y_31810 [Thermoguttaceae bacterium]